MDAFELLKNDHEKVSGLFKEIETASDHAKKDLFAQLKTELDLHAHIEEAIFYPALEKTPEAREITLEAYEEHKVVKDLLAELASSNTPNDEWNAKLTVLRENVEHHVKEEEGELFDRAEDALTQEQIDRLGDEMAAEKTKAQRGVTITIGADKEPATTTRATESKASGPKADQKTSILSTLANLVGLGSPAAEEPKKTKSRSTTRKAATKQKPAKKAATKKTGAKKAVAKKAAAKKAVAKKAVAKKAVAKKAGAKKAGAKKAGAKKAGAKKAVARKAVAKKAGARRASGKRASGSGNRKAALKRRSAVLKVSRPRVNKKRKGAAGAKRKRSR